MAAAPALGWALESAPAPCMVDGRRRPAGGGATATPPHRPATAHGPDHGAAGLVGGDQAIPVPIAPAGSNFLSDGKIQRQITDVP